MSCMSQFSLMWALHTHACLWLFQCSTRGFRVCGCRDEMRLQSAINNYTIVVTGLVLELRMKGRLLAVWIDLRLSSTQPTLYIMQLVRVFRLALPNWRCTTYCGDIVINSHIEPWFSYIGYIWLSVWVATFCILGSHWASTSIMSPPSVSVKHM